MSADTSELPLRDHVLDRSSGIAGGPFTQEAQAQLSTFLDGAAVRLTTSGTDALEVSAILAEIDDGDVVMVPSFGFVTTALAFVRAGAQIRFVDIDETTLGMDATDAAEKMDSTVRAIVPIHYGGTPCDIEALKTVVESWDRAVLIEDNAHGLFGTLNGRPLGTFGALASLSFHGTKNMSCGEGGAIVINDTQLLDRAEIVLEKGTDRRRFLRGEVDKYTWRDLGSSFGLSDYLAAVLVNELGRANEIQAKRERLTELYTALLSPHESTFGFRLPKPASNHVPAYHLYYLVLSNAGIRDALLKLLNVEGVKASFHYPPLHLTPGGRRWGDGSRAICPTSEKVSESIIRLPLHHRMSEVDVERTADTLLGSLQLLIGKK